MREAMGGRRIVNSLAGRAGAGDRASRQTWVVSRVGFRGGSLHVHRNEDEAFYVLTGRVSLVCGEGAADLGPGAFALLPRGLPHSFWNPHAEPARVLVLSAPGAVEGYFAEAAALAKATGGQPDPQRLAALAEQYGIEVVGPPPGAAG